MLSIKAKSVGPLSNVCSSMAATIRDDRAMCQVFVHGNLRHSMYTIKEASLRTGVGIPLLRAWERRYGIVVPTRTDAGYRLYDEAAIGRLRAMRSLVLAGWSPRQ